MFILFFTYFISYWTIGLIYFLADTMWPMLDRNSYLKYKISPTEDLSEVIQEYKRCIPRVLRNHLVVELSILFILEKYHYCDPNISLLRIIFHSVCQLIFANVTFSLTHWFYHNYAYWIHKDHHQFPNSIAICVEYLSLIENFVGYGLHHSLYYIFPTPFPFLIFTIIVMNFVDLTCHCGYNYTYMSNRHGLHHSKHSIYLTAFPWIEKHLGTEPEMEKFVK